MSRVLVGSYIPERLYPARIALIESFLASEEPGALEDLQFILTRVDSGRVTTLSAFEDIFSVFPKVVDISQENSLSKDVNCAICHEDMKNPIRMVKCGHEYCYECIRAWSNYRVQFKCPLCRQEICAHVSEFIRLTYTPELPCTLTQGIFPMCEDTNASMVEKTMALCRQECAQANRVLLIADHSIDYLPNQVDMKTALKLYAADKSYDSLVILNSIDPVETVKQFVYGFRTIGRRTYFLSSISIEAFFLKQNITFHRLCRVCAGASSVDAVQ
jgi:hypothetical protein